MGELDLVQDLAVVTLFAGIGGFLCQKIGLSSIVGFLFAGLLIGPHTPPFSIVMHEDRIEALSQLGLVFLMFSIGLDLSIGKLRRMGIGIVLAVALGAILVFNSVRLICPLLGVGSSESLFVAGMLVASSSAMIGKILPETGLIHQRAGNLAMSITVLEDLVAVVALTFISSVGQMHKGTEANMGRILGVLLVFVTVVTVVGLLLLPRSLQRLNRAGTDLLTITVAGLVLGIAVIAVKTGYSLALGAFLLGAIVAETPQRPTVERAMQGMRDVFIAVFFVSIGMLLNPALLVKNWVLILSLGIVTILVRTFAVSAIVAGDGNRRSRCVSRRTDGDADRRVCFYHCPAWGLDRHAFVRLLSDCRRHGPVYRLGFSYLDPAFRPYQRRLAESATEVLLQSAGTISAIPGLSRGTSTAKPGFRSCQAQPSTFGDQRHLRIRHFDCGPFLVRTMDPLVPGQWSALAAAPVLGLNRCCGGRTAP